LGFYFDRKLTFKEHVQYYTTKALTTVMAMRMLGNSTRGLTPQNKCILYHMCVLPIATYGHTLWYFDGAKVKGVLSSLTSMQRKAVCWITGAFRTSPTGGVESLAGLPSMHLHVRKLSERAIFRTATISDTRPLKSLPRGEHQKAAASNFRAACWLLGNHAAKVRNAITHMSEKLKGLTEVFSPCATENTPGNCLMDKYPSRVQFNGFDPKEEGTDAKCRSHLSAVFVEAKNTVLRNRLLCPYAHYAPSISCLRD
jgi:hypothetical protein